MQSFLRFAILTISGVALLVSGCIATETRLLLFWPAIALLGLVAILMPVAGRWPLSYTPAPVCLFMAVTGTWYLAIRAWFSPVASYSREDLFLILACYVAYLFSATVFSNRNARRYWIFLLAVVTSVNLGAAYVHFTGDSSFHLLPGFRRFFGDHDRIGGLYNNPNHLAAWLSCSGIILGALAFSKIHFLFRFLFGILAITSIVAVAYTQSRGGLIGCVAGIIFCVFLCLIWSVKSSRISLGGAILAFVSVLFCTALGTVGLFSEAIYNRLNSFSAMDIKDDARSYIWQAALDQAHSGHSSPILGTGARMFYEGCITYRTADTPPTLHDALFVHNDWLQLWLEYGWIGLLLVIGVIGIHFRNVFRRIFSLYAVHFSSFPVLTIGCTGGFVALLTHAVLDFHLHVPSIALLASGLLGIMANPPSTSSYSRKLTQIPGLRFVLKFTLIMFGGYMIYGSNVFGKSDYYWLMAQRQIKTIKTENDLQNALLNFDKAVALDDKNFQTVYDRGLLRIEKLSLFPVDQKHIQLKEAQTDLQTAHQLNPYNIFVALALADCYDATGSGERALETIQAAIEQAPLSMEAKLSLAIHYHRHQQWEKAEQAYLMAMKAPAHANTEVFALYQLFKKDANRFKN